MTISEIKKQLGIESLTLVQQLAQDKTPQPWVSHWDNTRRIRVTMHEEVLAKIKEEGPNFGGLALKSEEVPAKGDRAAYMRHVVITPNNIVACL